MERYGGGGCPLLLEKAVGRCLRLRVAVPTSFLPFLSETYSKVFEKGCVRIHLKRLNLEDGNLCMHLKSVCTCSVYLLLLIIVRLRAVRLTWLKLIGSSLWRKFSKGSRHCRVASFSNAGSIRLVGHT